MKYWFKAAHFYTNNQTKDLREPYLSYIASMRRWEWREPGLPQERTLMPWDLRRYLCSKKRCINFTSQVQIREIYASYLQIKNRIYICYFQAPHRLILFVLFICLGTERTTLGLSLSVANYRQFEVCIPVIKLKYEPGTCRIQGKFLFVYDFSML